MLKECNFKYRYEPLKVIGYGHEVLNPNEEPYDVCRLTMLHECLGEDKCILYQIYERLDIIELVKGHEKTLNALAGK